MWPDFNDRYSGGRGFWLGLHPPLPSREPFLVDSGRAGND